MTENLLLLSLTYVLLATLLVLLMLQARWHWLWRAAVVLVAVASFFVHYQSLNGITGWPSHVALPPRILLLASQVDEPKEAQPGQIAIWAIELVDFRPQGDPRAYKLRYNKDLHQQLDRAKAGQRKGIPQVATLPPDLQAAHSRQLTQEQLSRITIEDLADPSLPEK